jgi:hypothetical protein
MASPVVSGLGVAKVERMPAWSVLKPNSILSWRSTGTLVTVSIQNGMRR